MRYAELIQFPIFVEMVDFILEHLPCEMNDMLTLLAGYWDGTGEKSPTLEDLKMLYSDILRRTVGCKKRRNFSLQNIKWTVLRNIFI